MDIAEVLARAEITDVLARYARSADRGDWSAVRDCYHPDATDNHGLYHGGVDGLMDFLVQLSAKLISTTHQLGNIVFEIDGDVARTETYCLGSYHRPTRLGDRRLIVQGLRYLDELQRRDGRWAIASRVVVLDWEQAFDATVESQPETWLRGARGSADPSHGHLRPSPTP